MVPRLHHPCGASSQGQKDGAETKAKTKQQQQSFMFRVVQSSLIHPNIFNEHKLSGAWSGALDETNGFSKWVPRLWIWFY